MERVDAICAVGKAREIVLETKPTERALADQLDEVFDCICLNKPFTDTVIENYWAADNMEARQAA